MVIQLRRGVSGWDEKSGRVLKVMKEVVMCFLVSTSLNFASSVVIEDDVLEEGTRLDLMNIPLLNKRIKLST